MLNKITEQWQNVESELQGGAAGDPEDLQEILGEIVGVRDVLKRMCQVSVTRTKLKDAVREALLPVVREHRDELFPEIVELRRRLEAAGDDPEALEALRGGASPAAEFQERLDDFDRRIEAMSRNFESVQAEAVSVDEKVHSVDEKVQQVRQSLDRVEASVPETAKQAASEVEGRLRKEIEDMVEQLSGKLSELQEMLGQIREQVPVLDSLDKRLERLESRFATVSDQVGNIDSVTPEVRGLADQFSNLRQQIVSVSDELKNTGAGVNRVQDDLSQRLGDLRALLSDGISRWESDQSQVEERLTILRDTLRDQLTEASRQVEAAEGSFWGKLRGKKDAGLKLTGEEWDQLSHKLESIVSGLESILTHKRQT